MATAHLQNYRHAGRRRTSPAGGRQSPSCPSEETHTLNLRERARVEDELHAILGHLLMHRLMARVSPNELEQVINRIVARELDPYTAAETLLQSRET